MDLKGPISCRSKQSRCHVILCNHHTDLIVRVEERGLQVKTIDSIQWTVNGGATTGVNRALSVTDPRMFG